jgi:hypothetical protein
MPAVTDSGAPVLSTRLMEQRIQEARSKKIDGQYNPAEEAEKPSAPVNKPIPDMYIGDVQRIREARANAKDEARSQVRAIVLNPKSSSEDVREAAQAYLGMSNPEDRLGLTEKTLDTKEIAMVKASIIATEKSIPLERRIEAQKTVLGLAGPKDRLTREERLLMALMTPENQYKQLADKIRDLSRIPEIDLGYELHLETKKAIDNAFTEEASPSLGEKLLGFITGRF